DRDHEVQWDQLGNALFLFPEVERLEQLTAVERRLRHLGHVLWAGGPERVEAVLARANALLQTFYQRHPGLPLLTVDELHGLARLPDGGTRFSFLRPGRGGRKLFGATVDVHDAGRGHPRGAITLYSVIVPQ